MEKVLLGLSGGVDSAVSAAILKNMGFHVTACYLLLTEDASASSYEALCARRTAEALGIEFITADFRERFRKNVSGYFTDEYLKGRTPNPCVFCNPSTKFRSLYECGEKYGADFIATGHYAKICYDENYGGKVIKASASKKDQSYFLCRLTPSYIEKIIFPLGDMTGKEQVREMGKRLSLPDFMKPDSQEICFIPDDDYAKYIVSHSGFSPSEGNFTDINGNVIGRHKGIIYYTVGQRKGLGAFGKPMYVKSINARDNTVCLTEPEGRFSTSVKADSLSWAVKNPPGEDFYADVKVRSTAKPVSARVQIKDTKAFIDFSEKVFAPTPGQAAAFYKDGVLLGGGIITV